MKRGKLCRNPNVDLEDLRIIDLKCHATFSGEKGEIVVLLHSENVNNYN